MPITPKEMVKYLLKNGFYIVSQRGSHVKLRNDMTGCRTEVPMHSKDLAKGLESEILKQAGLKRRQ